MLWRWNFWKGFSTLHSIEQCPLHKAWSVMVHAVERDIDYFSNTKIGLEMLQAHWACCHMPYANILCYLWMTPLGKLSPAIQAGHLQSMPFGAWISLPFIKPLISLLLSWLFSSLRYHHISQLGGNHHALFHCIPTKLRQVTMMSKWVSI